MTREKRLHMETFPGGGGRATRNEQLDVKGHRLLELLAADAERVLALGTRTGGQRVLLLELRIARRLGPDGPARISVRELVGIPGLSHGDKFVARLAQVALPRAGTRGGAGEGGNDEDGDDGASQDEDGERHLLVATLAAASGRRSIFRIALDGTGMENIGGQMD